MEFNFCVLSENPLSMYNIHLRGIFEQSKKFFLIFVEQKGHRAHFCSKNRFLSILQVCDNPPTFGRGGYYPPESLISKICFTGYKTTPPRRGDPYVVARSYTVEPFKMTDAEWHTDLAFMQIYLQFMTRSVNSCYL